MASLKFSAETWRQWDKTGRDQFIKAIGSFVKDETRSPLFTKTGKISGVSTCIYELLRAGVSGQLRKDAVLSTLQEICGAHADMPSLTLDVACVLDAETSAEAGGGERAGFCQLLRDASRFLPERLLRERLEIDTLREAAILANNHFQTKFIKVKTKLYYKQRKFNLFREESEGYAKLITELNQEVNETIDWKIVLEIIKSLIGCFNLDPNRVLDIILESFEARPQEEGLFIPLVRNYMGDPQVICEVLGFKLSTSEVSSEEETQPSSLMTVIALLLQHQVIALDDIYPWLRPDDSVMARAAEKDTRAAQDYIRRLNIVSTKGPAPGAQPDAPEEIAELHLQQERYWANQKLVLAQALLRAGALRAFFALAARLPEHAATAPRAVALALADLLHATIEPLYREQCRVAPKVLGKPVPAHPSPLAPPQCRELEDIRSDVLPALVLLGPSLHHDPVLMYKMIRILRTAVQKSERLRYDAFTLLDAAILPALSLLPANCCMAEEVYTLLKLYPVSNRYCLYARWKNECGERVPAIMRVRGASLQRVKQIMKRVSKENVKPQGRLIGKLSHAAPAFVFDYMLLQIQIYDNLIGPMVESLKYLTSLSYDVLGFCLLEALAARGGPAGAGAGAHPPWLQSLAAFAGAAFKKYNIELTALLQYVANRLKAEHSQDLIIIKEIVQKMAGIESSEEMTSDQLEAMAGGELLKGEAGYFSQVRNTRRSSARLKEAVAENNLDIALCILAAQQRHCCVWKGTDWEESSEAVGAGSQLKVVGRLVDQCQDALVQLGTFLASAHSPEEYAARLPSLQELLRDYHVGPEVAFFLHRPVLAQQISARMEVLRRAEGKGDGASTAPARFADASREALEPVVTSIAPLLPARVWEDISPEFYTTFWSLTMYDLRVPVESYKREVEKLTASAEAAARESTADSKQKKEQERFQTLIDKLQEEKRRQTEHVARVHGRLERECAGWFPARAAKSAKNETVTRLMQLCLFPRCVFTPADALYCAEFVHTVHVLKTPNFSTLLCYDRLFCDITYSVMSCTEGEAARYGTFLCRVLGTAMRWHASRESFQRECANYPGFVTKYRVSNQFSENNEHVGYENYRHVCHKWHFKITKAMVVCLDSGDYAQIRNAITVLIRILPHFPVLAKLSQIIERKIDKVQEEEKNVRPDLYVLATCYHGQLRNKLPSMMRESEFHQVGEKVKPSAVAAAAVTPAKEDTKTEPATNGTASLAPPPAGEAVKDTRGGERRRAAEPDPPPEREKEPKRDSHGSRGERERMKEEVRRKDRSPRERSHREERYLEAVSPPAEPRHAHQPDDLDREVKRIKIESGAGRKGNKELEERSPDKDKRKAAKPRADERKERKMSRKRERDQEAVALEQKRRREEQKALKLAAHQNGSQEEHHYEKYHKREKSPFRERSHEHPEPRDKHRRNNETKLRR